MLAVGPHPPPANAGDTRDIGSLGQEDPLEEVIATHSCLENPMDRGNQQATVLGFTNSQS